MYGNRKLLLKIRDKHLFGLSFFLWLIFFSLAYLFGFNKVRLRAAQLSSLICLAFSAWEHNFRMCFIAGDKRNHETNFLF